MSKVLNDLNLLQDKLENLIERYDFLVEENEVLSSNLNNLHHKYQRKCNELDFVKEQYQDLKQIKTFVGSIDDKRMAKRRINTLIKEIDRCITSLND